MTKFIRQLMCSFGIHLWTWRYSDAGYIDGPPPDFARCSFCGVRYKKER